MKTSLALLAALSSVSGIRHQRNRQYFTNSNDSDTLQVQSELLQPSHYFDSNAARTPIIQEEGPILHTKIRVKQHPHVHQQQHAHEHGHHQPRGHNHGVQQPKHPTEQQKNIANEIVKTLKNRNPAPAPIAPSNNTINVNLITGKSTDNNNSGLTNPPAASSTHLQLVKKNELEQKKSQLAKMTTDLHTKKEAIKKEEEHVMSIKKRINELKTELGIPIPEEEVLSQQNTKIEESQGGKENQKSQAAQQPKEAGQKQNSKQQQQEQGKGQSQKEKDVPENTQKENTEEATEEEEVTEEEEEEAIEEEEEEAIEEEEEEAIEEEEEEAIEEVQE